MASYKNLDGTVPDKGVGALLKWQVTDRIAGKRRRDRTPFVTPRRENDGTALKSYQRYDFRLAQGFKLAGQSAELALVVQNAFNPYSDFRRENQFDTRTWVTFRLGQ